VTIRERPDPWCSQFEAELDAAGIPVALPHRGSWASALGRGQKLFVGVAEDAGWPRYGCGVDLVPLRSLPGHTVYRIERFGNSPDSAACDAALRAVTEYARTHPHVLRIELETFASEPAVLERLEQAARAAGFTPCLPPRRYTHTLRLDLHRSRDEIFKALGRTARRNLRSATKAGAQVHKINDPALAPALAALERKAFARTGGHAHPTNWPDLMQFCRDHPHLARIVGLFTSDGCSSADLLGFAVARAHGDHVEYASAGTVRRPGLNIPMGYPLLWHLIEWANELGVAWFDFGGITGGTTRDGKDALGGISDFKRYFGGSEIEVGGEWVLHVRPVRSRVANTVARVAQVFRT
jgi:hypothetical protein